MTGTRGSGSRRPDDRKLSRPRQGPCPCRRACRRRANGEFRRLVLSVLLRAGRTAGQVEGSNASSYCSQGQTTPKPRPHGPCRKGSRLCFVLVDRVLAAPPGILAPAPRSPRVCVGLRRKGP